MLLTKKKISRLAAPYNEGDMSIGLPNHKV